MNNHLSLRSGNPALHADSFRKHLTSVKEGTMSINGTVHKTGLSLFLLILSATYTLGKSKFNWYRYDTSSHIGFDFSLCYYF